MIELKDIQIFLRSFMDRLAKFDYTKLVPKGKVDKYEYSAGGVEMTWPWRREGPWFSRDGGWTTGVGLGLGFGLGKYDIWTGWPRVKS